MSGVIAVDRLKIILDTHVKGAAQVKQLDKVMADVEKRQKTMSKDTQGFFQVWEKGLMGAGLSFLFTGMAINRFFQGILQSMFQTFLMVEGEQGLVNEKMNELKARLAFLKFSFIDAFAQTGLLDKWLTKLENLLDAFNNLDEDTKAFWTDFAVKGAIAGLALMVIGQAFLGLLGIVSFFKYLVVPLFKWLPKILSFIAANPVVLLGAAIIAVTVALLDMAFAMGGVGNLIKTVAAGIGKVLVTFILGPITTIIDALNKLANMLADLAEATGLKVLAGSLRQSAGFINNIENSFKNLETSAYTGIDDLLGIDDIRNNVASSNTMTSGLLQTAIPEKSMSTAPPLSEAPQYININVEGSVITENELMSKATQAMKDLNYFDTGSPQG